MEKKRLEIEARLDELEGMGEMIDYNFMEKWCNRITELREELSSLLSKELDTKTKVI